MSVPFNHEAYRRCLPVASAVIARTKAAGIVAAKKVARAHPNEVAVAAGPCRLPSGAEGEYRIEFVSDDAGNVRKLTK